MVLDHLNQGKLARTFTDDEEDLAIIAQSDLLTLKKTIYVANLSENEVNDPESNRHYLAVKALADAEGSQCLPICAKLEADIAEPNHRIPMEIVPDTVNIVTAVPIIPKTYPITAHDSLKNFLMGIPPLFYNVDFFHQHIAECL